MIKIEGLPVIRTASFQSIRLNASTVFLKLPIYFKHQLEYPYPEHDSDSMQIVADDHGHVEVGEELLVPDARVGRWNCKYRLLGPFFYPEKDRLFLQLGVGLLSLRVVLPGDAVPV